MGGGQAPILVVGGTGMIGSELMRELDGSARVRALVRSPASADLLARRHPSAELVAGDLAQPETLPAAFAGVSRMFLLTPSIADQQRLEQNALAAASEAGVERIVYVSNAEVGWGIELSRAHATTEQLLSASAITHTVLRPDFLLDNLLHELDDLVQGRVVAPTGSGRCAFVDARDVAAVAALTLLSERPIEGPLVLSGPESLSWSELAGRLSAVLGATVTHLDPDPAEWASAVSAAGMPSWLLGALSQYFARLQTESVSPSSGVSRVTGREPRPVEDFARDKLAPALGAMRARAGRMQQTPSPAAVPASEQPRLPRAEMIAIT